MTEQTSEELYNGWTNRETWALNLHLTNTEGLYHDLRGICLNETLKDYEKEDTLRDWVEDMINNFLEDQDFVYKEEIKNLIKDVGSLWRVNYKEIIKSNQEE